MKVLNNLGRNSEVPKRGSWFWNHLNSTMPATYWTSGTIRAVIVRFQHFNPSTLQFYLNEPFSLLDNFQHTEREKISIRAGNHNSFLFIIRNKIVVKHNWKKPFTNICLNYPLLKTVFFFNLIFFAVQNTKNCYR